MSNLFEDNGATFNEDRTRRYSLWRIWDKSKPLVMFIGVNPSDANENEPDQTIHKVVGISKHNGYGGLYMMNLFTIISADIKILNDTKNWGDFLADKEHLINTFSKCQDVVFAWGNSKYAAGRSNEIIRHFKRLNPLCIKKNKNGSPIHPLFQKATSQLVKF